MLNFEDFYPRYAYKRYAYKKISVFFYFHAPKRPSTQSRTRFLLSRITHQTITRKLRSFSRIHANFHAQSKALYAIMHNHEGVGVGWRVGFFEINRYSALRPILSSTPHTLSRFRILLRTQVTLPAPGYISMHFLTWFWKEIYCQKSPPRRCSEYFQACKDNAIPFTTQYISIAQ